MVIRKLFYLIRVFTEAEHMCMKLHQSESRVFVPSRKLKPKVINKIVIVYIQTRLVFSTKIICLFVKGTWVFSVNQTMTFGKPLGVFHCASFCRTSEKSDACKSAFLLLQMSCIKHLSLTQDINGRFYPLQLFRRVAAALPGMDTSQDKSREESILSLHGSAMIWHESGVHLALFCLSCH